MKLLFGILVAFSTVSTTAEEPSPIPAKRWQFNCHRVLSTAIRNTDLANPGLVDAALPGCIPAEPVEFRYPVDRFTYADGILTVRCHMPLGWMHDRDAKFPGIYPTLIYAVSATLEQVERLRRTDSVRVVHSLQMTTDYATYLRDHAQTTTVVARIATGVTDSVYFYSAADTLQIGPQTFPIAHARY